MDTVTVPANLFENIGLWNSPRSARVGLIRYHGAYPIRLVDGKVTLAYDRREMITDDELAEAARTTSKPLMLMDEAWKVYDLLSEDHLPTAHGGCTCACHRTPGIRHVAACCLPPKSEETTLHGGPLIGGKTAAIDNFIRSAKEQGIPYHDAR